MNILYTRVSTFEQNSGRQRTQEKDYNLVIEDRCSGAIPFFERDGGKRLIKLVNQKNLTKLSVHEIDRLGRDALDILNTIDFFKKSKVPVQVIKEGFTTLDDNGEENEISNLILGILAAVAQMERKRLKERQREGIAIAKAKGNVYKGRAEGSKEDLRKFLAKPIVAKAYEFLKMGYGPVKVLSYMGPKIGKDGNVQKDKDGNIKKEINLNTITKIAKATGTGKYANIK